MSRLGGMSAPTGSTPLLGRALAAGPVVLDGGLATQLERAGQDVSGALWSARVLLDAPEAVVAAHQAYFAAGARVATTASYQASREGFAGLGLDVAASDRLLRRSVALAREAQDRCGAPDRWVAASVGPYGAVLADGSEYTGAYTDPGWAGRSGGGLTVGELQGWHRPRLEVLASAGPDLLACETLPALAEVEALCHELDRLDRPAWVSMTVVVDGAGAVRTRRGEPAEEGFAMAGEVPGVVAVGVNCLDPRDVLPAVEQAARASGKPVVAYPNSGETWDAGRRAWTGSPEPVPADVHAWVQAGVRLVGGCCRVGPEQVRTLADALAPV